MGRRVSALNSANFTNFTCQSSYDEAISLLSERGCAANESSGDDNDNCPHFCNDFPEYIPYIYGSLSLISAACCAGVFITYFFFQRFKQTGTSSKVFLYRTLMDLVIAVGHVTAMIFAIHSRNFSSDEVFINYCRVLGVVNEFALMASNLWYVFIAVDLCRAIRNPFSSQPRSRWIYHTVVWSFSLLCAGLLAILIKYKGPGGPGTSMFYWCWIDIEQVKINNSYSDLVSFAMVSLFLYYLPHTFFLAVSMFVVTLGSWILYNHLVASNETRRYVIKQNVVYVFVLALETVIIVPLWIAQLVLVSSHIGERGIRFLTTIDFGLAVVFAVVHSLRGTIDLVVWLWNFTEPRDIKNWCKLQGSRLSKRHAEIPISSTSSSVHLSTPLLTANKKDSLVNKALRRDAIYCINVGILESVQVHHDLSVRDRRVGSVRESFTAAALMELDQENQRDELSIRYNNPNYREQSVKKIKFPATSGGVKYFTFIDLEPTLFRLLRESYGISPSSYRKSFIISNLADVDGSLMLEKFTEGKSGSFLYFTQDLRFIIKTVSPSEERFLRRMAYSYYRHMQENNDSLIARFFGLHKIRMAPEQKYISVVVMENVVYSSDGLKMHRRYDLKGSWVGRRSLKGNSHLNSYKGVLKDLDLGEEKIHIGPELKEQLMEQLKKDVQFLTSCRIMDYSLLLGIHQHGLLGETGTITEMDSTKIAHTNLGSPLPDAGSPLLDANGSGYSEGSKGGRYSSRHGTVTSVFGCAGMDGYDLHIPWFRQDCGGLQSNSPLHPCSSRPISTVLDNRSSIVDVSTPPVTYFFGIIDILQQYTLRKHLEHIFKTRIQRQARHGLSCVNENEYGERFLEFMDSIIQ